MVKERKFKHSLSRNRQKKSKTRRATAKQRNQANLNPLTKENTQNQRIHNQNQCFSSHLNEKNDFKLKEEEDITNYFSFIGNTDNEQENNFFNFTGDDPTNIPCSINIDLNDSLFENDKIL